MTAKIDTFQNDHRGLNVTVNGSTKSFSWLWLRDHGQEPDTYHPRARQRLLETFSLGEVPPASDVQVSDNGEQLTVRWGEDQVSRFTADYLAVIDSPDALYDVIGADQETWTASNASDLCPKVEHDAFVNDDAVLADMLQQLRRVGMISIKDVPLSIEASRRVMERIAYIRSSIFGEMWELKADGKLADTGSTPIEIKPHTDGTYNHDAPGLMSLQCLAYDATGGDNVLVDGFNIARKIKNSQPEVYDTLSSIPVPGQYIGDGAYLVAQRPVFRHDARGKLIQVSFNNHDRAPFVLPEPQMSRLYEALGVFDHLIQDRANQFAFGQRPGDMVIFDNWRLLHGRLAFKGQRHMVGAYLNREDFESRMRVLAAQPLDMVA
ncbi:MAG TPA: TauD/TfdA family dioxygenase [Tianweitania sediminis]|jgi:trimethyllysine dioxygenase|nr:TauD/TfdA family dioxygenase [Tianweitania sediminis]